MAQAQAQAPAPAPDTAPTGKGAARDEKAAGSARAGQAAPAPSATAAPHTDGAPKFDVASLRAALDGNTPAPTDGSTRRCEEAGRGLGAGDAARGAAPPALPAAPPAPRSSPARAALQAAFAGAEAPESEPAMGRAAQVQAAIALENATGQPLATEPLLRLAALQDDGMPNPRFQIQNGDVLAGSLHSALTDAEAPTDQAAARILRGVSGMVNQRGGVMTMRLVPPELGELRVEMSIARGVVSAQFQASTAEASMILDRALPALRAALESHGLVVDKLTVHSPAPGVAAPQARQDAGGEQAQNDPRHHADAGEGQSRGRHDESEGGRDGRGQRESRERARFGPMFSGDLRSADP